MESISLIGLIVAVVLFVAGLVGTILPILPGAILVFGGTLAYGLIAGFPEGLNLTFYVGQAIAVAIILIIDYLAGIWGTKKFGGSRAAAYGSVIGAIVGIFALGPLGIILGPFIGAIIGDLISRRDLPAAVKAGWGTIIGFLGGTAVKYCIQIIMIIWFFIVIF